MKSPLVVKLGSSVVTRMGVAGLEIDRNTLFHLAAEMAHVRRNHARVVLVSSGAVAMGMEEVRLEDRPKDLPKIQAMAAVGQGLLMHLWREAFGRHGCGVGQILLTHSDLADRRRFLNVRATIESLLDYGVIPVINENDSVMTDEITVGDNDRLACQVAKLVGAERLLLLTSVDGLLDPQGQVVPEVVEGDSSEALISASMSAGGRGGMSAKLESARAAAHGGIEVIIANGRSAGVVRDVAAGQALGTRVLAAARGLQSRKHWIAYTLRPSGSIVVDDGAVRAVVENGASLLPVGVKEVRGDFNAGDAVSICGLDGLVVGRGLARAGANELRQVLGVAGAQPAIHRDDLVIFFSDLRREDA